MSDHTHTRKAVLDAMRRVLLGKDITDKALKNLAPKNRIDELLLEGMGVDADVFAVSDNKNTNVVDLWEHADKTQAAPRWSDPYLHHYLETMNTYSDDTNQYHPDLLHPYLEH